MILRRLGCETCALDLENWRPISHSALFLDSLTGIAPTDKLPNWISWQHLAVCTKPAQQQVVACVRELMDVNFQTFATSQGWQCCILSHSFKKHDTRVLGADPSIFASRHRMPLHRSAILGNVEDDGCCRDPCKRGLVAWYGMPTKTSAS